MWISQYNNMRTLRILRTHQVLAKVPIEMIKTPSLFTLLYCSGIKFDTLVELLDTNPRLSFPHALQLTGA